MIETHGIEKGIKLVLCMQLIKVTNWSCNFRWAWLNAEMLSAHQIAGFLNFNISKTIWGTKLIFLHAGTYLLKL